MSQDQKRRVIEAITECDKIISREMAYMEKHRKVDLIEKTEAHKQNLINMIAGV